MSHEVFEGKDGQHYFHVKGANGEIVATSEGYTRAHDAHRGYDALQRIVAANYKNEVTEAVLALFADSMPVKTDVEEVAVSDGIHPLGIRDHNLQNVLESLGIVGQFGETGMDTVKRILDQKHASDTLELDEPVDEAVEQPETPSDAELPPA